MDSKDDCKFEHVLRITTPFGIVEVIADDGHAITDDDEIQTLLQSAAGSARRAERVATRRKAHLREVAKAKRKQRKPNADAA